MNLIQTVKFTVAVQCAGGEVHRVLMLTKTDETVEITDYLKESEKESIKDDVVKQGRMEPEVAKVMSGNTLLEEFEVDTTVFAEVGDGYAEIEEIILSADDAQLNIEPFIRETEIAALEEAFIEHAALDAEAMADDDADRKMDERRMEDRIS